MEFSIICPRFCFMRRFWNQTLTLKKIHFQNYYLIIKQFKCYLYTQYKVFAIKDLVALAWLKWREFIFHNNKIISMEDDNYLLHKLAYLSFCEG